MTECQRQETGAITSDFKLAWELPISNPSQFSLQKLSSQKERIL